MARYVAVGPVLVRNGNTHWNSTVQPVQTDCTWNKHWITKTRFLMPFIWEARKIFLRFVGSAQPE